ncbi:MAG: hypothetical protein GY733_06625, partial [bacterium]|nr:hypothetical protein [bacterium]
EREEKQPLVPKEYERSLPRMAQDDLDVFVDEFGRKHYATPDGRPVCGRLKRVHNRKIEDEACFAPPMANGACRVHGGKAGAPIRTGRYSRVLKKMRGAFERARADEDLIDARRDLAAMDVLIEQLFERVEELDSRAWRQELLETFQRLQAAIRSHRQAQVSAEMRRLGELIEQGASVDQLANDLIANLERRANRAVRIGELELKRSEKVTFEEMTVVLREFLGVLEQSLEPQVYHGLLPQLRKVTSARRIEAG